MCRFGCRLVGWMLSFFFVVLFLMSRRPPRSTQSRSSAASDVYKRQNLLREGLDLPEVSLVAIMDADKEGFLRSATSLIQTFGRAARHVHGEVIMYADKMTEAMQTAINETNRRRAKQEAYNEAHHISPVSITKAIKDLTDQLATAAGVERPASHNAKDLVAQMEVKQ